MKSYTLKNIYQDLPMPDTQLSIFEYPKEIRGVDELHITICKDGIQRITDNPAFQHNFELTIQNLHSPDKTSQKVVGHHFAKQELYTYFKEKENPNHKDGDYRYYMMREITYLTLMDIERDLDRYLLDKLIILQEHFNYETD